jgi:hypothetical protein
MTAACVTTTEPTIIVPVRKTVLTFGAVMLLRTDVVPVTRMPTTTAQQTVRAYSVAMRSKIDAVPVTRMLTMTVLQTVPVTSEAMRSKTALGLVPGLQPKMKAAAV